MTALAAQSSGLGQFPKETDAREKPLAPGRPEGMVNILGPFPIAYASVPFLRIADSYTHEMLGKVAENPTLDAPD